MKIGDIVEYVGDWKNKIRDKIKLDKVLKHNIKMIYANEGNKDNFFK